MKSHSLWIAGPAAVAVALVATLAVRALGMLVIDVSPAFPPLDGPGPTIFFTLVSGVAAVAVYAIVRRASTRADRLFRWIALVVLILSFLPDLWLLGDAAAEAFPGATPGAVGILMAEHVAAAVAIVWALTGGRAAPSEA